MFILDSFAGNDYWVIKRKDQKPLIVMEMDVLCCPVVARSTSIDNMAEFTWP
jgi:hypothetical protein